MITDGETNFLYLSDKLAERQPFLGALTEIIERRAIPHQLLPGTKDIWAVDYMPVQINKDLFVRFVYHPSYLTKSRKWITTITDTDEVCEAIGWEVTKSDILLDGGNVIRGEDWVIMTDRIFTENPHYTSRDLMAELEEIFGARVVIIPQEPGDFTGHADGVVRYYDRDTVLVNRYPAKYRENYQRELLTTLQEAGLKQIPIAYNTAGCRGDEAHGIYMNFLEMKGLVVVPLFGLKEDDEAVRQFEQLYPGRTVETIDSRMISKHGGVLNCITWNVCV